MIPITKSEARILEAVQVWYIPPPTLVGPTIKEIMALSGMKSNNQVSRGIAGLIAKGYLTKTPGKMRTIALTKLGQNARIGERHALS